MASINVINVLVKDPIARFSDQYKFEIVFECLSELKEGNHKSKKKIIRYRMENNLCWKRGR